MDADVALRHFSEVPYVIEAPASSGRLASAAAAAVPIRVTLDPTGLPKERYREMLARLGGDIRDRLPSGGYRIDVLDRTADDLRAEGRRVDRTLSGYAEVLAGKAGRGAFSGPYKGKSGLGCIITGFPPDLNVAERLSTPLAGAPIEARGLDAESFHWYALRHELGHCLLGASESRAEAFAALMAIRDGRMGRDRLSVMAAYREASEWTNPDAADPHFVSATLWEVVRRSDALAANAGFMGMDVEQVAELARSMSDRHALSPGEMEDARTVRRGLLAASAKGAPSPGTPAFSAWVASHPGLAAFRRLELSLATLRDGTGPLPRFRIDLQELRDGLSTLARSGDATASAILAGMSGTPRSPRPGADFASAIPLARKASTFDYDAPAEPGRMALRGAIEEDGVDEPAGPRLR